MARRVGGLFLLIAGSENLRLAYLKARRGKQTRPQVQAFAAKLDKNLTRLRRGLLGEVPLELGAYRYFMVYDPKPRRICAAAFSERVLHHAIMNVCEPVFEGFAVCDSYACRKNKGGDQALARAQKFCARYPWYLKLDIRKYFDSIDHRVLLHELARRFREQRLLGLFDAILATYETVPGRGLPIGNLISQHLANFYLGSFDHWLQENLKVAGYLRYMDDFLLFAETPSSLKNQLHRLRDFLTRRLKLELKDNVQLNRTTHGVPFLGYRVFAHRLRLTQVARRRFRQKFRLYEELFQSGNLSEEELQQRVTALLAVVRKADTVGLRRELLATVPLAGDF